MPPDSQLEDVLHRIDRLNSEAWEVRVSDSNIAFSLGKEAAALAREAGYRKGLAQGLRTYGFGFIRLSKYKEAKEVLDESLALFEELGDVQGKSEVYEY